MKTEEIPPMAQRRREAFEQGGAIRVEEEIVGDTYELRLIDDKCPEFRFSAKVSRDTKPRQGYTFNDQIHVARESAWRVLMACVTSGGMVTEIDVNFPADMISRPDETSPEELALQVLKEMQNGNQDDQDQDDQGQDPDQEGGGL